MTLEEIRKKRLEKDQRWASQFSVGDLVMLRSPLGQKSPSNFGIIIEIHPDTGFGDSCRVYWDSGFQGAELLRSLEKLQ